MGRDKASGKTEYAIRFGCGGIFGVLLGLGWALYNLATEHIAIHLVVGGLLAGCLAARYGDKFWDKIRDWFPL